MSLDELILPKRSERFQRKTIFEYFFKSGFRYWKTMFFFVPSICRWQLLIAPPDACSRRRPVSKLLCFRPLKLGFPKAKIWNPNSMSLWRAKSLPEGPLKSKLRVTTAKKWRFGRDWSEDLPGRKNSPRLLFSLRPFKKHWTNEVSTWESQDWFQVKFIIRCCKSKSLNYDVQGWNLDSCDRWFLFRLLDNRL